MPALSKKYKINYKRRYTIPKNKKQRGRKSIKVYHNRAKQQTRKRKYYMGGDIEVPGINSIFPSGQTYQPNVTCLEKECDKTEALEKTTACLNTRIVMNLFRQTLDASEQEIMGRIDGKFTDEERKHVQDLTEKYLTNYVDSLFSKSFFSKNTTDLTPENTQKLRDLLDVIKPEYVDYLKQTSTLSDEIKQKIRTTTQPALNVVVAPLVDAGTAVENQPEPEDELQMQTDARIPPDAPVETEAEAEVQREQAAEGQMQPDAEVEAEAQRQQAVESQAEVQRQQTAEAEEQRQQAAEAEAQRQQAAEAAAKKAAKKEEAERFNAAKKAEMEQRFAQRRADSAAAEVKRKEDLAEKKAARAAAALIKEENRAAAKTLKNTNALKKSSGTRKKR
jgi:hypothetical protein